MNPVLKQTSRKDPPKVPPPKWVFLTPEDAKALLASSENRPIKASVKKEYKRQMENGLWLLSPHGITLGNDGLAADGNHRLHALAESTVEGMWFLVANWDVRASDLRVDRGSTRTMGDFLGISSHRTAPLTFIASLINVGSSNRRDPEEMLPITNAFLPYVDALLDACGTRAKGRTSGVVTAGICVALSEKIIDGVYDSYRAFVLRNSGCWESFVALGRQIDTMKIDSFELCAKSFIAASEPENTRLQVRQDTLDTCRKIVRKKALKS